MSQRRLFWPVALLLLLLSAAVASRPAPSLAGSAPMPPQAALAEPTPSVPPEEAEPLRANLARVAADRQPAMTLPALPFTPCTGGTAGGYPCNNVDLAAFMPLASIGGGEGNDIWGWTDPQSGKEYALMGRTNGTAFVDVSVPTTPIYLGTLPSHTVSSLWRDIKVYQNHAFIVSEAAAHGMQIFDLTQLRTVASPPVTFSETAHYPGFGNAHNIVINEDSGFAYAVGTATCGGGLHIVNIQNPTMPLLAGCFATDGYTHDAQCVIYQGPDSAYQGSEICFNANEDTLTIVDVSNKTLPQQLARQGYSGSAYTHQNWLTEDHRFLLLDDELDEQQSGHNTRTYIWDVSDLNSPQMIGSYNGTTASIDHNLYIRDGYAYQANYRSGLRILDIANIEEASLSEVAFFDVYPASNSAQFNGAWSVYPFFESGTVIVSGIEQGLFVLQPTLGPDFNLTASATQLQICGNQSAATTINVQALGGFAGNVNLAVAALPPGLSAAFAPSVVSAPGSSQLTLSANGAAPGSYVLSVEGTSGALSDDVALNVRLFSGPPATVFLQQPSDGATNQPLRPTLRWNPTAQAARYTVQVATDAAFNNVVVSASNLTSSSFTLTSDLAPDTSYFWRVRAENDCGVGSFSAPFDFRTRGAAGACSSGTVPNIRYGEDFEDGESGWSSSGTNNSWSFSDHAAHSGSFGWHAADLPTLSDQRLVSPAIAIPSSPNVTLQFWSAQQIEKNGTTGCYDGGRLELSTNGLTWSAVPESLILADPYDGRISSTHGNVLAGQPAWCGDPQPWTKAVVDLSDYGGQTLRFRFRLVTDQSGGRAPEGWTIDDVTVQDCAAEGSITPTPNATPTGTPAPLYYALFLPLILR